MGIATSILDCSSNPLNPTDELGEELARTVVESPCPLRLSRLWSLQRECYSRMGQSAWSENLIPSFVTSNAFVARGTARLIAAALWDAHARGGERGLSGEPVYIVELGAGHGKLGYLVVEALLRMRALLPPAGAGAAANALPFCYVLTDSVDGNVRAMRAAPGASDWIAAGALDFAVCDVERDALDAPLELIVSGRALREPRHALFCIAKYVVSALTTDAFRVTGDGALAQARVALISPLAIDAAAAAEEGAEVPGEGVDTVVVAKPLAPEIISRLRYEWTYDAPCAADALPPPYAGDASLLSLVRAYAAGGSGGGTVTVPLGGLHLLRRVRALAGRAGALVLLGDKGTTTLSAALATGDPHIAAHGAVSVGVNFHALRAATTAAGGFSLCSPHADGFKVMMLAFPPGGVAAGGEVVAPFVEENGAHMAAAAAAAASVLEAAGKAVASYCSGVPPPPVDKPGDARAPVPQALLNTLLKGVATAGTALPVYPSSAFGAAGSAFAAATIALGGGASPQLPRVDPSPPATPTRGDVPYDLLDPYDSAVGGGRGGGDAGAWGGAWSRVRATSAHILGGAWLSPDDFSTLQRGARDECAAPSVALSLALLRLANHDSDVFLKFRSVLLDRGVLGTPNAAGSLEPSMRDLRSDIDRVFAAYYPLNPSKDVCFELARLLMALTEYGAALTLFAHSRAHCGQHHVTSHNEGLCFFHLGRFRDAARAFAESLAARPDYADADEWLERAQEAVRAEEDAVAGRGGGGGGHGAAVETEAFTPHV